MSLALQAVAPSDYFEFGPDCVLDGNYGACLHFKCREHRAKLVNHQRIVAVHQQMPTPLAHTHYEELDLKIGWRLPLTKHIKDSLLSILVLRRRTLRAFEPADHVFHLISFSANGLTDQNRLSLLLRGLAHPFRFPYTSSRPRAAALCAFSQGAHHGPKHMSVPGSAGCPRSPGHPLGSKETSLAVNVGHPASSIQKSAGCPRSRRGCETWDPTGSRLNGWWSVASGRVPGLPKPGKTWATPRSRLSAHLQSYTSTRNVGHTA